MGLFPKLLRIPPVVWTCCAIMNIYLDKIQQDEERTRMGLSRLSMGPHVYEYFLRQTGLRAAADVAVAQLLRACEAHHRRQPRIALFAAQVGLADPEAEPPLDLRDTDFVLSVLQCLIRRGELTPDLFKSREGKKSLSRPSVVLKPDVVRITAVHVVTDVFQKVGGC
ncbi:hypothetical protein B484DRAFT_186201 [Ochromonadaceae sp. CCMP2298]|nr:hypothetical protein B484DRAFT_186201 [Ochromonadaceae sp. CCMP2298]